MELPIVLGVSVLGLVVAALLARWVLGLDQGPENMRKIAGAIRSGAEAFLRRQNGTIVKIALPLWDALFGLYFHRVVPAIGALVAGDRQAYTYLPESVDRFLTAHGVAAAMRRAGLRDVSYRTLGLGSVALHVGVV